jgi:hypothetical protein
MFYRLLVNSLGIVGVNDVVIYDMVNQLSANRFKE